VTLVVPYSPGGGTDAQSRAVARELQRIWGQTVIVDNTAGADGLIGTRKVIESKPDGYTLLVQLNSLTLLKHLPTFKGTDPVTQLVRCRRSRRCPASSSPTPSCREDGGRADALLQGAAVLVRHDRERRPPAGADVQGRDRHRQPRRRQLQGRRPAHHRPRRQQRQRRDHGHHRGAAALQVGALRVLASAGKKRSPVMPRCRRRWRPECRGWTRRSGTACSRPRTRRATSSRDRRRGAGSGQGGGGKKTFAVLGAEAIGNTPAEFAAMVKDEGERMGALVKRFPIE
jgi:hypothetical protein